MYDNFKTLMNFYINLESGLSIDYSQNLNDLKNHVSKISKASEEETFLNLHQDAFKEFPSLKFVNAADDTV